MKTRSIYLSIILAFFLPFMLNAQESYVETFEGTLDTRMWDTVLKCSDESGSVYIDEVNNKLIADASSGDCGTYFETRDIYNGILSKPVPGDFDVVVKITLNEEKPTTSGARAGIILGSNINPNSPGIASATARPNKGEFRWYYDSDQDGIMDAFVNPSNGHSGTTWLKMERREDTISVFKRDNSASAWEEFGSGVIGFGDRDLQVGLAASEVEAHFDSLTITPCAAAPDTIKINATGGSIPITTSPSGYAIAGSTVQVDLESVIGTSVKAVSITDDSGAEITFDTITWGEQYTFIMADTTVNIDVELEMTPFAIMVSDVAGGTATVTTTPADNSISGDTITVQITNIEAGKQFASLSVKGNDESDITIDTISSGEEYTFVMPPQDVHVNVAVELIPYDIVISDVAGGTAVVSTMPEETALADSTVIINIAGIEAGKQVSTVTVTAEDDSNIAIDTVSEGSSFSFSMPAQTATIAVTLEDIPTYSISVADVSGGTADVSTTPATEAAEGELVTVYISNIEAGKQFSSIEVTAEDESVQSTNEVSAGTAYTFDMPAQAVTVAVTLDLESAILSSEAEAISVYPNPVADLVTINGDVAIRSVSISDASGTVVLQQEVEETSVTFDLSQLNAGLYLITINTAEGNITKQLIKE